MKAPSHLMDITTAVWFGNLNIKSMMCIPDSPEQNRDGVNVSFTFH